MTNPPGEPPNDLTLRLLQDGGLFLDLDTIASMLAAVMSTPRHPEASLVRYWSGLYFAAPDLARSAWRLAWRTCEPEHRLPLLLLAVQMPGLDPQEEDPKGTYR